MEDEDHISDGSVPGLEMNGEESDHLSEIDGDEDKRRKKKKSISPHKKDKKTTGDAKKKLQAVPT
jgi:hypothetical protein